MEDAAKKKRTQDNAGTKDDSSNVATVSAATLIPLRKTEQGGIELLMAQIEVLDALKSTENTKRVQPFAGELRFFGGGNRGNSSSESPMEIISR